MNRRGFLVGFLAGGWIATLLVLAVLHAGFEPMSSARAEDPPGPPSLPAQPFGPNGPQLPGPTVNPIGGETPRGMPNPGNGTSDSNQRAIALAASIGGGESAVYYFDTVAQRLCVYQYKGGSRGGLRLLAARYIDYDLKLESYRDESEHSPREMRAAYEASRVGENVRNRDGALPTVSVGGVQR
jgi:hypothetical protein